MATAGECKLKERDFVREYPCATAVAFVGLTLFLIATGSAHAATEYRFSVTSEGAYPSSQSGRIVTEGERWRLDLDSDPAHPVRAHDTVIQTAPGCRVAINHANRTWFALSGRGAVYVPSLFDFHRRYATNAVDLEISPFRRNNGAPEEAVFHYKTRVDIDGETIHGSISGRLVRMTRDEPAGSLPMPAIFALFSGTASVDDFVNKAVLGSRAALSQLDLTIDRRIGRAPPMTQTIRWSIAPGLTVQFEPSRFDVPAGYTERFPQIGVPGHD